MNALSRRLGEACVSDLVLDQLEDLPAERVKEVERHLDVCEACKGRASELRADRERFVTTARPITLRAAPRGGRAGFGPAMAGAVALAAAAAVTLSVQRPPSPGAAGSSPAIIETGDIRTKGTPYDLGATVERGSHQHRIGPGDPVAANDRLQLSYSSDESVLLYVVGVDGTMKPERYFPEAGKSARVEEGHDVELGFSLVLDEAPGPERFYGFFCAQEVERGALDRRAVLLASGGAGPPLSGCEEVRLELPKR